MYTTRAQRLICVAGATAMTGAIFSAVVSIAGAPPGAMVQSSIAASTRTVHPAIKTAQADLLPSAPSASMERKESGRPD